MSFSSSDPSVVASNGEMAERIQSKDWSTSPLGALNEWPASLRTVVRLALASDCPMCITWGPEYTQIYNDAFRRLCGASHPRALGQDFRQVRPSVWATIERPLKLALAGESSHFEQVRLFIERGDVTEEGIFSFSFSPLHDDAGAIQGVLHLVTDATRNVIKERRTLLRAKLVDRLQSAESVHDVMSLAAAALAQHTMDVPFCLFYAQEPERGDSATLVAARGLEPASAARAEHVDLSGSSPWPLAEVLRTGTPATVDGLDRRFDDFTCGPYPEPPRVARIFRLAQAEQDHAGIAMVLGVSSRLRCDGDYKEFHETLVATIGAALARARDRERIRQLHDADRGKDEFLAVLAHELRNPLAPIRSGLDLLALEQQGEPQETIKLMQQQVDHLVRLVDDLLDVSRIMQGQIELRRETVDLAELVRRSVETVQPSIEDRQQALSIEVRDEPLWIDADPVRIVQVVGNLLTNAAKYSDRRGRIELVVERGEGSQAVVRVQDDGVGIDSELLPRVFDLFTQSSRSVDRAQGGLGIGLTLVHRLVSMHGGRVTVASEGPDRGSTFTVRLPLAQTGGVTDTSPAEPDAPRARRILVVDDNETAAQMLSMLLTTLDEHEVQVAYDGAAALEEVQAFQPEIVLLDIGLPGMSGYEVAQKLRGEAAYDGLLLVALTGYGQSEDRQRSQEAGFDEHLVKPPSLDQIKAILGHPKLSSARPRSRERPATTSGSSVPPPTHAKESPDEIRRLRHELRNAAYGLDLAVQLLAEPKPDLELLSKTGEGLEQEAATLRHVAEALRSFGQGCNGG